MKRSRRLSFSVIFGRSDLISFSSDDRNAAEISLAGSNRFAVDQGWDIREKHDFRKFFAKS